MKKSRAAQTSFAKRLVEWHGKHGRHDLPWQNTRNAYVIWVSEIMLQQTQVKTVIGYFERFMTRFPTLMALAEADEDQVLAHWSGLGYYARGRNLHQAARIIVHEQGGIFPRDFDAICALPGIGRSTAAAISAFAYDERRAILDGNVKRVLTRCFGIEGFPGDKKVESQLWALADGLLPDAGENIAAYTQAQMDLGAAVCVRNRPLCALCPLADVCIARRENRIADFPGKKARKAVPLRHTSMLILLSQKEVLLERRPPSGIWGGLWCFPELRNGEDVIAQSHARYGVTGAYGPQMESIKHGFTHFHLTIHPHIVEVTRRNSRTEQPGNIWIAIEDAQHAAIPTPVRKLLGSLSKLP